MDPAQLIVQKAAKRQDAMNAVIDRFDSPVQQFYRGATVLVTGGFGFLGKQLIEKLFRSCELKKMYVLVRSKKGKTIQERLKHTFSDPLYDVLRQKQPNFEEKVVPVEGDVGSVRLALSDKDWNTLSEEVNFIFHLAATVRFDMPLKDAVFTNLRGTREVLNLAKECRDFKNFIHVSTAFSHASEDRKNTEVLEQFYPVPVEPGLMIDMAESMESDRLDNITQELMKGWPNTYTFTKALSEELIRTNAGDLPVCVVRPPIVIPCYYEPLPGWLDMTALQGPSGILFGIGLGVVHTFCIDPKINLAMTPLDYVNNATIGAGWDSVERRKTGEKDIRVYTVANKDIYVKWDFIAEQLRYKLRHVASPKTLWYGYMVETQIKAIHFILSILFHYIPAYIMDGLCAITGKSIKEVPSFVGVYRKLDKFGQIFNFFLTKEWYYRDYNVQEMLQNMNEADRAIFNCNLKDIDKEEFIAVWCMGLRQYIVKDGLQNSAQGQRNQKIYKVLNVFYWMILATVFYYVSCVVLMGIKFVFSLF